MARLAGFVSASPVAVRLALDATGEPAQATARAGVGLAAFLAGAPTIERHRDRDAEPTAATSWHLSRDADHALLQAGAAGAGDADVPPIFEFFKWTFGAADALPQTPELIAGLKQARSPMLAFVPQNSESATEYAFRVLLSELMGEDMSSADDLDVSLLPGAIARTVKRLTALAGEGVRFTTVLTNGTLFAASCVGVPLFLLQRGDNSGPAAPRTAEATGLIVEVAAGPRQVLVATEPLTDEAGWRAVPDRYALTVDGELTVSKHALDATA